MTKKADYTAEEWQLLLDVPALAGLGVMMAGKSGLGTMKETPTRTLRVWPEKGCAIQWVVILSCCDQDEDEMPWTEITRRYLGKDGHDQEI